MGESRIKNTKRNLIYAIALQIVKITLVFIGRIIFVKKLGASYLGVNGLFANILGILSLADFGITTALMYGLYKPLAEKQEEKIAQYLNYFKKIYNVIAIAVFLIGISLIPFLKSLVNLPSEMPNIYLYYILLLLNTVISYLFVYKTTLLAADQKMYVINKYDTIFQFVLFFLQITVLIATKSFALYLLMNVICTFTGNILKVKKTKEIYPFLEANKNLKLPKEEKKNIFTNLFSLFLYKLGGVIQTNTDNILISIFMGTIVVGYYSNYSTIILAVTTFLNMIFTSLKASVGNYVVSKNGEEPFKLFTILETYNFWIVGFCAVCFMCLIPDFINICFGQEYILSYTLLLWAVVNFYTANIRQTLWMYRETTGVFKETRHITFVTSIINIFLSIIFGYLFGLEGIVAATVFSRMVYAWWKEPRIIYKKCFKKSSISYFISYIRRFLLLVVVYGINYFVCMITANAVSNMYISFILKMLICVCVPSLLFVIVYRKSIAFTYLKENMLKKILKSR